MTGRAVPSLVLFAALLASCASEPPRTTARGPATAGCAELADEVIAELQVVVDELGAATLDDLVRDELISEQAEQRLDGLESRVDEAGCRQGEIDGLLADRADRIRGDGVVAEAIREALGEDGELPFPSQG